MSDNEMLKLAERLERDDLWTGDRAKAVSIIRAAAASAEPVEWADDDYRRALDCMIGILRDNRAWPITKGRDEKEFDEAFQHAVGILSLTAKPAGGVIE